jgi:hypothetical protein
MRTIIAGSRNIPEDLADNLVAKSIELSGFTITEIISGNARGIDKAGERYWQSHFANKEPYVGLKIMPANWNKYGKSAGQIRNIRMAAEADALIAIWDGESPGTQNMIKIASRKKMPIFIYFYKSGNYEHINKES